METDIERSLRQWKRTAAIAIVSAGILFAAFIVRQLNKSWPAAPERPVIEILPDLMTRVNAETPANGIPWYSAKDESEIQIRATLLAESRLVKTVRGDYAYTVHHFTYTVDEVQKGAFTAKELTFFVERAFPTPESGIILKDLWPFTRFIKGGSLVFKLRKGAERYVITSIERGQE